MSDLVTWLRAQLDEDERAAWAAVDPDLPGTHWQWVTSETDQVVQPGDIGEALQHQAVSLRSVEKFPTASVGPLPAPDEFTRRSGAAPAGHHLRRPGRVPD